MPEVIDKPPEIEPKTPPEKTEPREDENKDQTRQQIEQTRDDDRKDRNIRPAKRPLYKRPGVLLIAAIVFLLAIIFGGRAYLYSRAHESTDDAFIDGHIIEISPKVAGHIIKVYVDDNQDVKEGDLLAEI